MNLIRKYKHCATCGQTRRTTVKKESFTCRRCKGAMRRIADKVLGVEKFPFRLDEKHLRVILCLKEEAIGAKELSRRSSMPLATVYRVISQLMHGGFIDKVGQLYELKEKTRDIFLKLQQWDLEQLFLRKEGDARKLRFHALQGNFLVSNPPDNFERYRLNYMRLPVQAELYPVGRNKNLVGLKLQVFDCLVVMPSPKSISVTFPTVWVNELGEYMVPQGYCKLGLLIDALAHELEEIFPGLKIDSVRPFELTYQEIAITNSVYAKRYYEQHGTHLKEEELKTDKSKTFELETVRHRTAADDILEGIRREKAEDERR